MTNRRFIVTLDVELPIESDDSPEGYVHPRDLDWTTVLFDAAVDGERVNKATVTEIPLDGRPYLPFPE